MRKQKRLNQIGQEMYPYLLLQSSESEKRNFQIRLWQGNLTWHTCYFTGYDKKQAVNEPKTGVKLCNLQHAAMQMYMKEQKYEQPQE